jgi:hypothetical protein
MQMHGFVMDTQLQRLKPPPLQFTSNTLKNEPGAVRLEKLYPFLH